MGVETIAAVTLAVAAAAGTSYQVAAGERQARMAKRSFSDQQNAQRQAEGKAAREDFLAQEQLIRQRRKKPDVSQILADQASQRPASSLTGGAADRLLLGRPSALGA
mgnify:CR=1 FL=1